MYQFGIKSVKTAYREEFLVASHKEHTPVANSYYLLNMNYDVLRFPSNSSIHIENMVKYHHLARNDLFFIQNNRFVYTVPIYSTRHQVNVGYKPQTNTHASVGGIHHHV